MMRSEPQVLDQILEFARAHDAVRAVVMNGSRVNPNAPKDMFCDYDVVYFVPDPRQFLEDQSWIPYFGELIILQQNDFEINGLPGYIFLMLFSDGVRIDLAFNPLPALANLGEDTLTTVLLDKDRRIPSLPPASDTGYYTPRPTPKEFAEAVNEVFWCSNNIAKGIWRDELPYTKAMYDRIVHPCVLKLVTWYTSLQHNWQVDTGTYGKWLKRYLPPELYTSLLKTYPGANYDEIWASLFEACQLTQKIGVELANALGYEYPLEDDRRVIAYLNWVRTLPKISPSHLGETT